MATFEIEIDLEVNEEELTSVHRILRVLRELLSGVDGIIHIDISERNRYNDGVGWHKIPGWEEDTNMTDPLLTASTADVVSQLAKARLVVQQAAFVLAYLPGDISPGRACVLALEHLRSFEPATGKLEAGK